MKKQPPLLVLLALGEIALLLTFARGQGGILGFADGRVYLAALATWLAGRDPYLHAPSGFMNFLYPPFFLYAGGTAGKVLSLKALAAGYVAAHVAAALAVPWIVYRYYVRQSKWPLEVFYLLYFLAPGLSWWLSLDTGNIAVLAYAVMLAAGVPGLTGDRKRGQWLPFYLAVFFFASIKITFLPVLLLPLLCGRKQWLPSLLCAGATAFALKAQGWLSPALFQQFRATAEHQSASLGDVGEGVFGVSFHVLHKAHHAGLLVPVALYALVASSVIAAAWKWRASHAGDTYASWPAIVLLVVLFSTPRLQYYDLCYGCPIAVLLTAERLSRKGLLLLYLGIALPALYFRLRTPYTAFDGGFQACASLVLLVWLLRGLDRTDGVPASGHAQATGS